MISLKIVAHCDGCQRVLQIGSDGTVLENPSPSGFEKLNERARGHGWEADREHHLCSECYGDKLFGDSP